MTTKIEKIKKFTHYLCNFSIIKIKSPKYVKNLMSISWCNVLYIIISKVLSNLWKPMLSTVISTIQSSIIPGRLITANALVTFEIFHSMKHRMKG